MKIKKLELRNFKKFTEYREFRFTDEDGEINDMNLIIGENGSGKSTLLQAIVLLTASDARTAFFPEDLHWAGFNYDQIKANQKDILLKGEYYKSEEEYLALKEHDERYFESLGNKAELVQEIVREPVVQFDFERGMPVGHEYHLSGHLVASEENKRELYNHIGNIFWYTEQRTSFSFNNLGSTYTKSLDELRRYLADRYTYHLAVTNGNRKIKNDEFDFYDELHQLFKKVFPNRSFIGSTPSFDPYKQDKAPLFFLNDGKNDYEISEMSAGERAIFPLLIDFVLWNINHSIIIIDEFELHLHPPLQQALIRALPKLGNDNQFIITSHSNSVAAMFKEDQIIRL